MSLERNEIHIMKLEDDVRELAAELPGWARVLLWLWLRYKDGFSRNELAYMFKSPDHFLK